MLRCGNLKPHHIKVNLWFVLEEGNSSLQIDARPGPAIDVGASPFTMAPLKVGDKLPDGTVKGLDMKDISIKELTSGKKVIIFGVPGKHMHVFAKSYSPCRLAIVQHA